MKRPAASSGSGVTGLPLAAKTSKTERHAVDARGHGRLAKPVLPPPCLASTTLSAILSTHVRAARREVLQVRIRDSRYALVLRVQLRKGQMLLEINPQLKVSVPFDSFSRLYVCLKLCLS